MSLRFLLFLSSILLFLAPVLAEQYRNEHGQRNWIASPPAAKVDSNAKHNRNRGGVVTNVAPEVKQIISSIVQDHTGAQVNKVKIQFNANYVNPFKQQDAKKKFGKQFSVTVIPTPPGQNPVHKSGDGDDVQIVGLPNGNYQFIVTNNLNHLASQPGVLVSLTGAVAAPALPPAPTVPAAPTPVTMIQTGAAINAVFLQQLNTIQTQQALVNQNPTAAPVVTNVITTAVYQRRRAAYNVQIFFNAAASPNGLAPLYQVVLNTGVTYRATSSPLTIPQVGAGTYVISIADLNWKSISQPFQVVVPIPTAVPFFPPAPLPAVTPTVVPTAPMIFGTVPVVTSAVTVPGGLTQVSFNGVTGAVDYTAFASVIGSASAASIGRGSTSPITLATPLPTGNYYIVIQANMANGVGGTVSQQFLFVQLNQQQQLNQFSRFNSQFRRFARIDEADAEDEVMATEVDSEVNVEAADPGVCAFEDCNGNGRCVTEDFRPKCICNAGWTGKECGVQSSFFEQNDDEEVEQEVEELAFEEELKEIVREVRKLEKKLRRNHRREF